MQKVEKEISLNKLEKMTEKMYDHLVKAVVDIERKIMVVDAEMHADQEKFLLKDGSKQENLWGINLYPEMYSSVDFVEFDSMINIRPTQNNRSRGIEDEEIQLKIKDIVNSLVKK
jgi:Icc-related predicted phosphoesterase